MKAPKIGLLGTILTAIVVGIGLGLVVPEWIVRTFITFNGIFSQFLGFAIPLIIVGLVTPAISDIGRGAGKMLLATVLIAYGSTVFAGLSSYLTGAAVFPSMISPEALKEIAARQEPQPFFTVTIPPLMNVMTALVLAFVLGLGLAALDNRNTLKDAVHDFEMVVVKTISTAIIPLLPLYIFGIFLNMTYVGQVFSILTVFIKVGEPVSIQVIKHIFRNFFGQSVLSLHIMRDTAPIRIVRRLGTGHHRNLFGRSLQFISAPRAALVFVPEIIGRDHTAALVMSATGRTECHHQVRIKFLITAAGTRLAGIPTGHAEQIIIAIILRILDIRHLKIGRTGRNLQIFQTNRTGFTHDPGKIDHGADKHDQQPCQQQLLIMTLDKFQNKPPSTLPGYSNSGSAKSTYSTSKTASQIELPPKSNFP